MTQLPERSSAASMPSDLQLQALDLMGIDVWVPRSADNEVVADALPADWDSLRRTVAACERCGLSRTRRQTVFGTGNVEADWMIVGEAPGADEDRQGEPFVGRAGQLLNEMLAAVGLQRESVFIANILKCRPPNNRNPEAAEIDACRDYLSAQIERVNPKLIVAVGRIAAQSLLHDDRPVGRMRGQVHELNLNKIPVVVTYHPAYLLRSPGQKRKAWADLCLARSVVAG